MLQVTESSTKYIVNLLSELMELDYILGRPCYILVPLGSTGKQYVVAECIV